MDAMRAGGVREKIMATLPRPNNNKKMVKGSKRMGIYTGEGKRMGLVKQGNKRMGIF